MKPRRGVREKVRLGLERLEERTVPVVFTVNSTLDLLDINPGDGLAEAVDPDTLERVTTLRAAIMEANALPGHDTVYLPAGYYRLSIKGADEDGCRTGDLDILDPITIQGEGADVTFVETVGTRVFGHDRIFDLHLRQPGVTTLSGFTVTGGTLMTDGSDGMGSGAGIRIMAQSVLPPEDSANDPREDHPNQLLVVLNELHVTLNTAADRGGGVFIRAEGGFVRIMHSTISGNFAREGGGVAVDVGTVSIYNSTISQNRAGDRLPGGLGGGIFNQEGEVDLVHATVAFNGAYAGGGLYVSPTARRGGQYRVCNSIIAANNLISPPELPHNPGHALEGPDLYGFGYISDGGNLIGNGSGSAGFVHGVNWDMVGDDKNVLDPLLGPLVNNGGPTPTHLPQAGSLAIDNGLGKLTFRHDQRNFGRPVGVPDIGAVEVHEVQTAATDLVVDITTPNGLVRVGSKLTYTILVTNAGQGAALNAQLDLLLPHNARFLSFSTTVGSLASHSGRNLSFDLGTLLRGEQATITVTVKFRRIGLAVLEALAGTRSLDSNLSNNYDVAYHYAGRPLYIDDRVLTLLMGRPNGQTWGNGHNGNSYFGGGPR